MINLKTEEVFRLSDFFSQWAGSIGEYIEGNKRKMIATERNNLYDAEIDLLRLAGEINIAGVNLVFEDVEAMLHQLDTITEAVKKAVKQVLGVQDAINLAAGLVTVGSAIIAMNPKAIIQSTINLAKSIEVILKPGDKKA